MTASEEPEFVCPECGADIPSDAKSCPGCGVAFAWEGAEGATGAAPPAAGEAPSAEEEAPAAEEGRAPPPEAAPAPKGRLYGGHLSVLGVAFVILAVLAVVGTLLLMHWDVWVSGASGEAVGPRQGLLIGLGYLGILVCLAVVVFDVLRHR